MTRRSWRIAARFLCIALRGSGISYYFRQGVLHCSGMALAMGILGIAAAGTPHDPLDKRILAAYLVR